MNILYRGCVQGNFHSSRSHLPHPRKIQHQTKTKENKTRRRKQRNSLTTSFVRCMRIRVIPSSVPNFFTEPAIQFQFPRSNSIVSHFHNARYIHQGNKLLRTGLNNNNNNRAQLELKTMASEHAQGTPHAAIGLE